MDQRASGAADLRSQELDLPGQRSICQPLSLTQADGQGDRPDEGIGPNRGSDQPWKSGRNFCRRGMLPIREGQHSSLAMAECRVLLQSRVVAVGAAQSQSQSHGAVAAVVASAAGVSPLVIDQDLRRVPVVTVPQSLDYTPYPCCVWFLCCRSCGVITDGNHAAVGTDMGRASS